VMKVGNPAEGYDGYCFDLAQKAGITISILNDLNPSRPCDKCAAGERLCVTQGLLPPVPDPPSDPSNVGKCVVKTFGIDGSSCFEIITKNGITMEQLLKFNPDLVCNNVAAGKRVCVSLGELPSRAPQQTDPNLPCFFIKSNATLYNCASLGAAFDVSLKDIEKWNSATWRFQGCSQGFYENQKICISQGVPPKPDIVSGVECGLEAPLNQLECPLKSCCGKWGYW